VTYSGTIAAAMEGTLLGIPSIALSQLASVDAATKWGTAEHWAPGIIRALVGEGWPEGVLINLNFPDIEAEAVTGVRLCAQGRRKLGSALIERRDPRGRPYYWIDSARDEDATLAGTDLNAVNSGAVSVTPLYLDLTHRPTLQTLSGLFP
jgi:5'-nucleotidase